MPKGSSQADLALTITPRQWIFIEAYLAHLSVSKAAREAGVHDVTGSDWFNTEHIAFEIGRRIKNRLNRYEVTGEKIIRELAKLGFSNMGDYTTIDDTTGDLVTDFRGVNRDQLAAVSEITVDEYTEGGGEDARNVKRVKFKLADKRSALMDLAKIHKLVDSTVRHQVSGPNGGPIPVAHAHRHVLDVRSMDPAERAEMRAVLEHIEAGGTIEELETPPPEDEEEFDYEPSDHQA